MARKVPYGAFNFLVSLGDGDEANVIAGFSDVSGIGTEINFSEYRNGNDLVNTVRKIANTFKQEDVTLKRGLIGSTDLFKWVKDVREGADGRPRALWGAVRDCLTVYDALTVKFTSLVKTLPDTLSLILMARRY